MRSTRTGHRWAAVMVAAILMMLAAAIAAPAQVFTSLHSFDVTDGAQPWAGLFQASNGQLYGTTSTDGGTNAWGTVFKMTPTGTLTT
ncbi:MAG TPA: choice-of-anchor tandem repeat GloVer-containing protein, partial [Terriglobia bacterium]|nr:choice-of-anchor tandem repeat GloVer-containing protein [Terriglobia bacterium]